MIKIEEKNAVLVLADGTCLYGWGAGATGVVAGEICFNTSMTGYQEILTDPSYSGQIITFTFPHIGNVGTNPEDYESLKPYASGLIIREDITSPANYRAQEHLVKWLTENKLIAIHGIDTRQLTQRIRDKGFINGVIGYAKDGKLDIEALKKQAAEHPSLEGMDLAGQVTCEKTYHWTESLWHQFDGFVAPVDLDFKVVAIDYGIKHNILRNLVAQGFDVTVVPATTSAEDILALNPDGIFLSNGPGDPAATGKYAISIIQELLASKIPVFGICLGHQLLGLSIGAKTAKMDCGHRGANHPVKNLKKNTVEITSQNHGFMVLPESLPDTAEITHLSLFDGSLEGIALKNQPAFSVQYHPEASPGPQDSVYLFEDFKNLMRLAQKNVAA
ncbi:MAG: glutamine-hydrolyzing carbamoyl-phosphate synthase small subunit [Alphaproteobacteria bacterium]